MEMVKQVAHIMAVEAEAEQVALEVMALHIMEEAVAEANRLQLKVLQSILAGGGGGSTYNGGSPGSGGSGGGGSGSTSVATSGSTNSGGGGGGSEKIVQEIGLVTLVELY